ncbi:MaoC family dehydratase [Camelimonas abortus]|uniref:MaoC family dehydratase n=1 Tax=Camelimonas abortus TaxID=1017184 RepID=A0ABV7LGZ2_9HYPH
MTNATAGAASAGARAELTPEELEAMVGKEIGVSRWIEIDQNRINQFADVTEDWQFIHVNPEAAAKTPFGSTIAHGFLTMSLMVPMSYDVLPGIKGRVMGVNYGLDKLRFLAPVKVGKRVRGRFVLKECTRKAPNQILLKHEVTVEIEGEQKPALIAEWLGMSFLA